MRDSFSSFERQFVGPYRSTFAWLSSPLVRLLVTLRVPPNAVSVTQIPLALCVIGLLDSMPRMAFLLFLSTLLLDSLDGALARAYGRTSTFGALCDQVCDHTRETLVIVAVALPGALHVAAAVVYPFIYALFNFLLFFCNYRGAPVPWAVKSLLTFYPALFLYTFFGVNWLTPAVSVALLFMGMGALLALRNLSRVME